MNRDAIDHHHTTPPPMSDPTPGVPATDAQLLGVWQLLRCEAPLEIQPGTRMQFDADGQLHYAIPTADGLLRVTLRWQVRDGVLRTWHEDGSNPVAVPATLGQAEILSFNFDGRRAFFVRAT